MQEAKIIQLLREYCLQKHIKDTGVLVITIQKNFTGLHSSLVVDFDKNQILGHYPAELLTTKFEEKVANYYVCYLDGLPAPKMTSQNRSDVAEDPKCFPFCCERVYEWKGKKLDKEIFFSHFMKRRGHHPGILYEVKKQVDNGPIIWTKYFQLANDTISEVDPPALKNKIHSFKNYKCDTHHLFYAVDLTSTSGENIHNFHHMRLNPFTYINSELLESFFNQELGNAPTLLAH